MKNPTFSQMLAVLVLMACCTACSTTSRQRQIPPYLQTLSERGVPAATTNRIANKQVLQFDDILALVQKGIPGDMIVPYLKATRANYSLSKSQINRLVSAGADTTLVNYLGRHSGAFLIDAANESQQENLVNNYRFWRQAYFTDPFYYGDPPFDFLYPMGWY